MPTTPEASSHHSSRKLSILLPLIAIQNHSFHYETPCMYIIFIQICRAAILYLSFFSNDIDLIRIDQLNWRISQKSSFSNRFRPERSSSKQFCFQLSSLGKQVFEYISKGSDNNDLRCFDKGFQKNGNIPLGFMSKLKTKLVLPRHYQQSFTT